MKDSSIIFYIFVAIVIFATIYTCIATDARVYIPESTEVSEDVTEGIHDIDISIEESVKEEEEIYNTQKENQNLQCGTEETTDTTNTTDIDIVVEETQETEKTDVIEEVQTEQSVNAEESEDWSESVYLGEFKLTAYCSCSKCCGEWAYNRPKDENGNDIVYGSIGVRLVAGTSIAVDPNVIPYGSKILINGNTYIAHDTGGAINGNRIDVYFDNHQDALNFGVRYADVYIKK